MDLSAAQFARNPDCLDLAIFGKDFDDVGFALAVTLSFSTDDAAVVLTTHLFDSLAQGNSVALHCGECGRQFRRCDIGLLLGRKRQ